MIIKNVLDIVPEFYGYITVVDREGRIRRRPLK